MTGRSFIRDHQDFDTTQDESEKLVRSSIRNIMTLKDVMLIDTLETQAREAADEARKAAAIFALWAFASLLIGAFVASFAATYGGRARDL